MNEKVFFLLHIVCAAVLCSSAFYSWTANAAREPQECEDGERCEWWDVGAGFSLSMDRIGAGAGLALGLVKHSNTMGHSFIDLHAGYVADLGFLTDENDNSYSFCEFEIGHIGILSGKIGFGFQHRKNGGFGGQFTVSMGFMAGFLFLQRQGPNEVESGLYNLGFQLFLLE